MQPSISDHIGRLWLDSTHTVPTRALQLAFERANDTFQQVDDFSIVLSILKNNPATVPPELVNQIEEISKLTSGNKTKVVSARNAARGYSQTIDPFRSVLPKYLQEKSHGLHQYASASDCSLELVTGWVESRRNDPATMRYAISKELEIVALGHVDYLRLTARAIENMPTRLWQAGFSRGGSTLGAALGMRRNLDQKSVGKLFKKLSTRAHLNGASIPEHQDMVLMLSGDRICVRPASFTQEAEWAVSRNGGRAYGSVHNLLKEESPVHFGFDPLEEFEVLMNSQSAVEYDFQSFFERHPRFLLGTDYARVISQPVLVREDEHDLIPDFIMVPHSFGRPTILDLKLPRASIARHKTNREGFLQAVIEARDQLLEYRNYFSSKTTAEEARSRFGCDLYLPRIAVIIGRSSSFIDEYERRKIESRHPDIDLITYDDVYQRAKQCRALGLL